VPYDKQSNDGEWPRGAWRKWISFVERLVIIINLCAGYVNWWRCWFFYSTKRICMRGGTQMGGAHVYAHGVYVHEGMLSLVGSVWLLGTQNIQWDMHSK